MSCPSRYAPIGDARELARAVYKRLGTIQRRRHLRGLEQSNDTADFPWWRSVRIHSLR